MKRFPKVRTDSGLTLIELLIAVAISGIILAGMVTVFTTANRAYTRQDETATLQQSLRVAKMNLERDIRMAGSGFGTSFIYIDNPNLDNPNPIPDLVNTAPIPPLLNSNGGGNANSDILTIRYVNYSDPCDGVLPQKTPTGVTAVSIDVPDAAAWWSTNVTGCKTASAPFLAVYTRPVDPVRTTRLQSNVITITGAAAGFLTCTGLTAGIPAIPPMNSSLEFFSATQLVTLTYSYNSANRTLDRNGLALADNIEDFHLAFGLDTNGNGVVADAEWVNNADLNATQRADLRIVRVSILGRSTNPINGQALNARPAIEDNIAGTAQDHHLRQLLQFDIALRNVR